MSKLWTFGDSFTFGHGCRPFLKGSNVINEVYYTNYIDLSKPIWAEYLSQKLNLELLNLGLNGASNELILDKVFDNINNLKKEDLIIIQISTSGRYDFPFFKEKKLLGGWGKEERDFIYDPNNKSPYFLKTVFNTTITKNYEDVGENALLFSTENVVNENLKLTKEKYDLIKSFFVEFISTKKYYERQVWRFVKLSEFLLSLGFNVFMIHEDFWPTTCEKPKNLISTSEDGILHKIIRDKHTIMHDTNKIIMDYHPSYDGHIAIGEDILKHINENTNLYNT